ncbi:hypothetical protein DZF91_02050 [Actinomadura logoneensis]|uniref:Uncharacterized protein n=1 Tax=Actinomadura logoneensis TaxID=2293572 RepID=A0A372JTA2_9ACTN|nr:hypothetical protein [Actinomadura logoneensis]RFU43253.1 hypothetical protein DZF91_02050 [Actinomadura logoneensis]
MGILGTVAKIFARKLAAELAKQAKERARQAASDPQVREQVKQLGQAAAAKLADQAKTAESKKGGK